jgi:hypothetical protein
VAGYVRVRPGDVDAGGLGESPQAAGGRVTVYPGAAAAAGIGMVTYVEPVACRP